ncbi:Protein of unknown function [Bacillus mycoides]|nr:Protein of unknown function [Bacillus mycoides]SCM93795.1 Protein of unknown function [Bacillus mycoides]
MAVISLIHLF